MRPKVSIVILVSLMLMMLLASGCERSVSPHRGPVIDLMPYIWDLERSPREDKEAEVMALCLSNRLVAPEHLYQTISHQLAIIRAQYGDSIPQLREITFKPLWVTGELFIKLTLEAREEVRRCEYHDLDFLNARLKLAQMDTTRLRSNPLWVYLTFEGRLHPERLVELYGTVASVVYVKPNYRIGDRSNIYLSFWENRIIYLFREARDDCPSGRICERHWWFEATPSGINYIGSFDVISEFVSEGGCG